MTSDTRNLGENFHLSNSSIRTFRFENAPTELPLIPSQQVIAGPCNPLTDRSEASKNPSNPLLEALSHVPSRKDLKGDNIPP